MIEQKRVEYVHIKTGNLYNLEITFGIKLLRKWFYLVVYRSPKYSMYFVRTEKDFNNKFELLTEVGQ